MSRVLPILFNTEMVQAILDGRKTVTRRILKLPSYVRKNKNDTYTLFAEGTCYENQSMESILLYLKTPYHPGDILYVRETWCKGKIDCGEEPDGRDALYVSQCTGDESYIHKEYVLRHGVGADDVIWKPSIHMPKEAARIFLRVKGVNVERLKDISPEQAVCEGTTETFPPLAVDEFRDLWNSTIKKEDLDQYGWEANPWVWAIEFERCEKTEGGNGHLISREALLKEIVNRPTEQSGYNPVYLNGCATRQNEIIDIINDMPTVESVPVVHGEWIHVPSSDMATGKAYECSNCKKNAIWFVFAAVLSNVRSRYAKEGIR